MPMLLRLLRIIQIYWQLEAVRDDCSIICVTNGNIGTAAMSCNCNSALSSNALAKLPRSLILSTMFAIYSLIKRYWKLSNHRQPHPAMNSLPNMPTTCPKQYQIPLRRDGSFASAWQHCQPSNDPPSLYLDWKIIDLSRHGSISIFSLYIAPGQKTYLINIHSLGRATFSTTNNGGTSLKTTLDIYISDMPKVEGYLLRESPSSYVTYQCSMGSKIKGQTLTQQGTEFL